MCLSCARKRTTGTPWARETVVGSFDPSSKAPPQKHYVAAAITCCCCCSCSSGLLSCKPGLLKASSITTCRCYSGDPELKYRQPALQKAAAAVGPARSYVPGGAGMRHEARAKGSMATSTACRQGGAGGDEGWRREEEEQRRGGLAPGEGPLAICKRTQPDARGTRHGRPQRRAASNLQRSPLRPTFHAWFSLFPLGSKRTTCS